MYPHQNNIRERRGGQPPMAPQHLMGMPQQGPGMLMSMNQPPVQIMTQGQHHYSNQNSYSTQGQSNVSASYVAQQQGPQSQHQGSNYHQSYSSNNPQVVLTKQAVNRKNYRKEYNVVKDTGSYNDQKQSNYGNSEFNSNNTYNSYSQSSYNGQTSQSTHSHQDISSKNSGNKGDSTSNKEKDETTKEELKNNSENSKECPSVTQSLNVKEKTPMCLVNELARFNKITHQYRLTDEQGPAHKKSFTVTLTLGTEEYTAEGPSIKKAQHSAAAEALAKTSFQHPTPKTNKNVHSGKSNITPTVELNALAMKRGEPAIYKLIDPPHPQQVYQPQPAYSYRRPYGIRGGFNKRGRANLSLRGGRIPLKPTYGQNLHYTVSLKVGSWEFFGEGNSPQSARHDAASKALSQLKMLPVPEDTCPIQKDNVTTSNLEQDLDSLIKSPISLVHEIALKRNMNVLFQVISEKGPPHMKVFVTKCTVGDLSATGEGNGKKVSKKRAAENMLAELKKLPPLSPSLAMGSISLSRMKRKAPQTKKKSRNLIKIVQEHKTEPEYGDDINPISRLIQIQQVKKEKEPVYTLLEEKGMPRRREFVMEVAVGSLKATGNGPNKKLAKKAAAQNLLTAMGYAKPDITITNNANAANPSKPALKTQEGSQDMSKDRKVTFVDADKTENNAGGSVGRQVKPGIYVMADSSPKSGMGTNTPVNIQTTATIAKELLKGGNSPTADALIQNSAITKSTSQPVTHVFRPKDQLLYLADLLHFQVQFSDFPKGNHSEFLSLVTMSTDPSHVCHGSGPSIDESQDQAALTALRALSEMGLDSVTTSNPTKDLKKSGKGMGSMKK